MLGHKLVQEISAASAYDVHATGRRLPPVLRDMRATFHEGVELHTGSFGLAEVLQTVSPDFVLNAVGAIKQKGLQSAIDATLYLNATLPHLVALLNPNKGCRVIHFSTDCVFKGDRGHYAEAERPDAEDLYGISKAAREIHYGRHLTIRTSIIGFLSSQAT